MKARYHKDKSTFSAYCPSCESTSSFYMRDEQKEFGTIVKPGGVVVSDGGSTFEKRTGTRTFYVLVRCGGCMRGGLATVTSHKNMSEGELLTFYPIGYSPVVLPVETPDDIKAEFKEAQECYSYGLNRAASGMLRSTLEKILKANDYTESDLFKKIEAAANDGIIHQSRKKKAHDNIRVLGNDILHDEWRKVEDEEVEEAIHYTQRIIEDFYDDRPTVEATLSAKKSAGTT